jgi:hypothetical protein
MQIIGFSEAPKNLNTKPNPRAAVILSLVEGRAQRPIPLCLNTQFIPPFCTRSPPGE